MMYKEVASYKRSTLLLSLRASFGVTMNRLMWESWVELGNDQEVEIENRPLSSHALEQFSSKDGKGSTTEEEDTISNHTCV